MAATPKKGSDQRGPSSGLKLPILANLGLLIASAAVLLLGIYHLSHQRAAAVEFESRFVTAEWRLLAELKERTDQLLFAKDREIALLRSRLFELVREGAPEGARRDLSVQLEQAYLERQQIMELRMNPTEQRLQEAEEVAREVAPPPGEEAVELTTLAFILDPSSEIPPITPSQPPTLAWYRGVLANLVASGPEDAARLLRDAPTGAAGLDREDRSILEDVIEDTRQHAAASGEFSRLDRELRESRAEALTEARQAGVATGQQEALEWNRLLLDYLSGGELSSPERTRQQILELWEAREEFRELVIRAQRLAEVGVADGRDDLPAPVLVGYLRSVADGSATVELLTAVELRPGDRVQVRRRSQVPPGELIAEATVVREEAATVQIMFREGTEPRINQLVYVMR